MPQSQYRARDVSAKTQEVIAYDHDESLSGKPLHILIPGGLVPLAALAVMIYVAYLTWFQGELDQSTGLLLIGLLAPFYVGGVFLFSYGYELYNIPRALRLTAIIVFLTFAAVLIVAVLFFLLRNIFVSEYLQACTHSFDAGFCIPLQIAATQKDEIPGGARKQTSRIVILWIIHKQNPAAVDG